MLDSIYHTLKSHFLGKNVIILSLCTQNKKTKINKPQVVYRFYCMALFHSQTQRHMIKRINSFVGMQNGKPQQPV